MSQAESKEQAESQAAQRKAEHDRADPEENEEAMRGMMVVRGLSATIPMTISPPSPTSTGTVPPSRRAARVNSLPRRTAIGPTSAARRSSASARNTTTTRCGEYTGYGKVVVYITEDVAKNPTPAPPPATCALSWNISPTTSAPTLPPAPFGLSLKMPRGTKAVERGSKLLISPSAKCSSSLDVPWSYIVMPRITAQWFKALSGDPINKQLCRDRDRLTRDLLFDSQVVLKFRFELWDEIRSVILPTQIEDLGCIFILCRRYRTDGSTSSSRSRRRKDGRLSQILLPLM
ncbi:hypothetical protein D9619_003844 [Psilocybe cf. subviscida]|uniref:HAM1-like N-terminal domain-containing protein n=1 Tax=Psilocybe cf. subviscida TaxID=2480587 RepID=A0A8H5AY50_9AGAR|nr:hypothetical protein D9619_003844 [Psilocybe cf. subviscida]